LSALEAAVLPSLKALAYLDSNRTGECDWRTHCTLDAFHGYREIAPDPVMHPDPTARRPRDPLL